MSLISLIITLVGIGVLLWLVNTCLPLEGKIKQIPNLVVVLRAVGWRLYAFGSRKHSSDIHVPPVRSPTFSPGQS